MKYLEDRSQLSVIAHFCSCFWVLRTLVSIFCDCWCLALPRSTVTIFFFFFNSFWISEVGILFLLATQVRNITDMQCCKAILRYIWHGKKSHCLLFSIKMVVGCRQLSQDLLSQAMNCEQAQFISWKESWSSGRLRYIITLSCLCNMFKRIISPERSFQNTTDCLKWANGRQMTERMPSPAMWMCSVCQRCRI